MSAASPLWIPVVAAYLGVAWAAVFHRFWGRRRYRLASLDYWSSCGDFVALALLLTLPLPPVMAEIDRLTGLGGLADTLADIAALLTLLAWLIYLSRLVPSGGRWLLRRESGWWVPWRALLALLALATALLLGRFVLAPGELGFRLGPAPDAARYYLTSAHLAYRAACLAQLALVILVLRRLAAVVGPLPALQARLRAIRWVLWYMVAYIAYESISAVVLQLPDLSSRLFRLRSLLLLAAIVAPDAWYLALLALLRRAADFLGAPVAAWRDRRDCRRLYPLWAALHPVEPRLSHLAPPDRARAWRPGRPATLALCRMVAEIRDWGVALWSYHDPRAVAVAEGAAREAGMTPDEQAAFVEAVALAAALANWRAARSTPVLASDPPFARLVRGGATLPGEVAALLPVADHFARGVLITTALARLGEKAPSPIEQHQGVMPQGSRDAVPTVVR